MICIKQTDAGLFSFFFLFVKGSVLVWDLVLVVLDHVIRFAPTKRRTQCYSLYDIM